MKIRIAIADDHPMIIDGLKHMLAAQPHISLEAIYNTGEALLEGLGRQQPELLLLDIQLPGITGDQLVPIITRKFPDIKILTLTSNDSALYIYNMLKAGVKGYILKNSASAHIIKAIEAVYKGEQYLEPALREKLDRFAIKMKNKEGLKPSLTAKEKEVLLLTIEGYSIQEIAEKIFLGQRTVEYYRSNLLLKLDARNLADLIRKALEHGLHTS